MIFVGDDWAEEHHDVFLMDEAGRRLGSRRLPEGLAGIGQLHELIAGHAEESDQVVIGIETDRGLWVGALVAAGYQVYAINPLAVARYRDRHHVSGAKSDASDAKLLADLVRTDRHNHRPVAGDSADAEAIKVLARAHQSLIWTRTRHTNVLRNAAGVNATSPRAPARSRPRCAPSSSPPRPRSPPRSPPPPAPRWASSPNSTARSASSRPPWRSILKNTRTPTFTAPCQDLVLCSAPGCSVSSGTTRTDTPMPSLAETTPEPPHSRWHPARNAPCWPVTCATAACMTPSTNGLSAPSRPAPAPAPSTTNTAPPATPTTKPCAHWATVW